MSYRIFWFWQLHPFAAFAMYRFASYELCPTCNVAPGTQCRNQFTNTLRGAPHVQRILLAQYWWEY
ncbi:MAG TPA: hypothetical protein VK626_01780 [Nitrospiraceae bacterium]|nr:hypothetical protein [Nitrospiraceae bacterium]